MSRGSIVSFIVVGVLLIAAVLGGLYIVKNQLGSWLGSQPAQEVREVAREATDSDDDTSTDKTDDTTDNTPEPAEPTPAANDDTADEPVVEPSTDDTSDDTADVTDEVTAPSNETTDTEEGEASIPTAGVELPQTGIADSLFSALPVVALVAAVVAYRRSNLL